MTHAECVNKNRHDVSRRCCNFARELLPVRYTDVIRARRRIQCLALALVQPVIPIRGVHFKRFNYM